jgi:hypothetical protein
LTVSNIEIEVVSVSAEQEFAGFSAEEEAEFLR